MPLTSFQAKVALLLSKNRTEDSHLAGGAALHFSPNSIRYSEDLDYFHDSEQRVASAFSEDRKELERADYTCKIEMNQPGYIRCLITKGHGSTKVEWAHDSAWRFMPVRFVEGIGYVLDAVDLSVNKTLTLAGRDEPRDYLDVLDNHERVLPLGALCWAACGKDPGLSPLSLLELLKRRGKYRPEDFDRLRLRKKVNVQTLKLKWLPALEEAENFVQSAPPETVGCLFYSKKHKRFVMPKSREEFDKCVPHNGQPGGVLPRVIESSG